MKASRTAIDAIGHEINAITAALGTHRKEMAAVAKARELYATIEESTSSLGKAAEKEQRIVHRIEEITVRLAAIGLELAAIPADPQMAEVKEKETHLRTMELLREEIARTYAAQSMTASHVLRKAEKIALRKKNSSEIASLKQAMEMLSDHELPDSTRLALALAAACPIAERMIAEGEISLKNKEERAVFSDTESFCTGMSRTCTELHTQEKACRDTKEILDTHPLLVKAASLKREQTQLRVMYDKELQAQNELAEWLRKTHDRIPLLREELQKKMGEIIGKNVQYSDDSLPSA
jgi:hypothetical protein